MKDIKILGVGCAKCRKLADLAETAAKELNIEYTLEKVTDLNQIAEFGVIGTPGLVVDGEVKVTGKVPSLDQVKKMLS
jgi:small redox-active disulfide protein 2